MKNTTIILINILTGIVFIAFTCLMSLTGCKKNDEILGCTYPNAVNYNIDATIDNGSCEFYQAPDVYFSTVIPGEDGVVMLSTNLDEPTELSSWTIGYYGNEDAFIIPNATVVFPGSLIMFTPEDLGFVVSESGFVLYLKDNHGNLVHSWDN